MKTEAEIEDEEEMGEFVMRIKDTDYSDEYLFRYLPRGCTLNFRRGETDIYTDEQSVDDVRKVMNEYLKNREMIETEMKKKDEKIYEGKKNGCYVIESKK